MALAVVLVGLLPTVAVVVCAGLALRRLNAIVARLKDLERVGVVYANGQVTADKPRMPLRRRMALKEEELNRVAADRRTTEMARSQ